MKAFTKFATKIRRGAATTVRVLAEGILLHTVLHNLSRWEWRRVIKNCAIGAVVALAVVAIYTAGDLLINYGFISQLSEQAGTIINPSNLHVGKALVAGIFTAVCFVSVQRKPRQRFLRPALVLLIPWFAFLCVKEVAVARQYSRFAEIPQPKWEDFFDYETGAPHLWYRRIGGDLHFYNMAAYELRPVTATIRESYFALHSELTRVNPDSTKWFNDKTGEAEIYFYKHPDGHFDFFNRRGYDPENAGELRPVTREVEAAYKERQRKQQELVAYARQRREEQELLNHRREVEAVERMKAEQAKTKEEQERIQRVAELRKLFNPNPSGTAATVVLGICVPSEVDASSSVQTELAAALRPHTRDHNIQDNFFRPQFRSGGYFDKVFDGDFSPLAESGVSNAFRYLLLGKMNTRYSANDALPEVVSCQLALDYRLLDNQGREIDSGKIQTTGAGFSNQAALDRAIEIVGEKYSPALLGDTASQR